MKQRKLFVGIAISDDIAKRIVRKMKPWENLPIRFVKQNNLHIALLPLGHLPDESVLRVCESIRSACAEIEAFDVDFHLMTLAPEQGDGAKQLRFIGEPSKKLKKLREALERSLDMFGSEKKVFRPHIVLGNVRYRLWQALDQKPEIAKEWSAALPIESVTVYESVFRKGEGLVFESLADCPLSNSLKSHRREKTQTIACRMKS